MDEHIQVAGSVAKTGVVLSDINLNSLTWWTAKHNGYASREAVDILNLRHNLRPVDVNAGKYASLQARRRRFLKEKIYGNISPGARALLYFIYRYIVYFGFLDGREGFYFHILQGLWYRILVDAKVSEINTYSQSHGMPIADSIKARTGIDIGR